MERSLTRYCQLRFVSIFTPMYLTLPLRYSLLPHNFIFKSPLNFFENFSKRCSMKSDALRNFAKLTGKHLCQSLLFNKVAGLCNVIKKNTLAEVFSCGFCEIFKNTFFYITPMVAASLIGKLHFLYSASSKYIIST